MARRSLALLSDGMLSDSTKRTLTFSSIGWLVPEEVPPTPTTQTGDGVRRHEELNQENLKRIIEQDNQDWLDLICIFLRCQN